jgi:hypothetical protein
LFARDRCEHVINPIVLHGVSISIECIFQFNPSRRSFLEVIERDRDIGAVVIIILTLIKVCEIEQGSTRASVCSSCLFGLSSDLLGNAFAVNPHGSMSITLSGFLLFGFFGIESHPGCRKDTSGSPLHFSNPTILCTFFGLNCGFSRLLRV